MAVAAAAALALPSTAAADTFCVQHAGCSPSHSFTTISAALLAAQANGATPDTIQVGPGTYDEDLNDVLGNPVTIVGSGDTTNVAPTSTTIGQEVFLIDDPGTSISSLKITLPPSGGDIGLGVNQAIGPRGPSFSHIDIVNGPSTTGGVGFQHLQLELHRRQRDAHRRLTHSAGSSPTARSPVRP